MYNVQWLQSQVAQNNTIKYFYFWGHTPRTVGVTDHSCFSQWFGSPFVVNGHTYNTAEHWMMAHKALLFNDHEIYEKILAAKTPGEAKQLGREVRKFDEVVWKDAAFDIVKYGNIHKFSQHPEMGSYLLNTGNRVLVEASPVDFIWGVGLAKDNPAIEDVNKWRGLNLLGFALMAARDALRTA